MADFPKAILTPLQRLAPLALAVLLQGCAAAGLAVVGAGAGVGMGTGVEHELNGVGYKTFATPIDSVHHAARATLARLAMPITADTRTDDGWKVSASAAGRTIDIELERLTPRTTRMRVVADKGGLFGKDSATSTEIILQTAQTLQDGRRAPRRPAKTITGGASHEAAKRLPRFGCGLGVHRAGLGPIKGDHAHQHRPRDKLVRRRHSANLDGNRDANRHRYRHANDHHIDRRVPEPVAGRSTDRGVAVQLATPAERNAGSDTGPDRRHEGQGRLGSGV